MRVLVAPDSFKGSLTAGAAARALAEGWRRERPDDELRLLPLADGGEGTIDALHAAVGGTLEPVPGVTGPLGAPVDAAWLRLPDGTGVVELAVSSGLPLAQPLDPLGATTRGVGEVVRAALRSGVPRLVLALGGSASTDGGSGLLRALGLRVEDAEGQALLDGGGPLARAARVDAAQLLPPPPDGVVVLSDVDNPLLGPRGAAAVYAPQKGAGPEDVRALEASLARWAALSGSAPQQPGAGAAGGTAYGLLAWWGATLVPGSRWVADAVGLTAALAEADLVLTGEGRVDATSLSGKTCGALVDRAGRAGVPAVVVCGSCAPGSGLPEHVRVVALDELAGSTGAALSQAATWAARAAAAAAREVPPLTHV